MRPAPHNAWLPAIFFSTACTALSPSTSPVSCCVGGIAHTPSGHSCTPRRRPRAVNGRDVRTCVECSPHVAGGGGSCVGGRDGGAGSLSHAHRGRSRFAHRG